jgi:uncharacterized protein YkwD
MADNGCFQHDSCDGTPWVQRLRSFYPEAAMVGKNIARGYPKAWDMVNGLVCDESSGQCAADHSSQAGHRSNMMDARPRRLPHQRRGPPAPATISNGQSPQRQ